jgi:hypothetical protein
MIAACKGDFGTSRWQLWSNSTPIFYGMECMMDRRNVISCLEAMGAAVGEDDWVSQQQVAR